MRPISLFRKWVPMVNRVFVPPPNRAIGEDGTPVPEARLYVYLTGTNTQVPVYSGSDLGSQLSQPIVADSDGVFEPMWTGSTSLLRLLMTDEDDVPLPGYPMDDVVLFPGDNVLAAQIGFSPTETLPYNNVQEAIEAAAALADEEAATPGLALTALVSGGSSNAYTITPDPAAAAYTAGMAYLVRPDRTNTGAATLNVSALGAKDLVRTSSTGSPQALTAGEIARGREFLAVYDGTRFTIVLGDMTRKGSTGSGEFTRLPDGTLWCWSGPLTFSYEGALNLVCTWTLPTTYSAYPNLSYALSNAAASFIGLAVGDIGPLTGTWDGLGTTVILRLYKATGAPNFNAGDSVTNVRVTAIGRG